MASTRPTNVTHISKPASVKRRDMAKASLKTRLPHWAAGPKSLTEKCRHKNLVPPCCAGKLPVSCHFSVNNLSVIHRPYPCPVAKSVVLLCARADTGNRLSHNVPWFLSKNQSRLCRMPVTAIIKLAEKFPVIVTVELAAIIVTLWWWSGGNVELLTMDARTWQGQFWRPFSSALPHVDIIHLVFNLYWLAVFGSRVEEGFGSLVTALWLLVFAAGSMVADYDFANAGVGLSGVGYGLFGFLWVLSKRDPRFTYMIHPQLTQMFIGWFFLCLALTYADIWHVANVAHAAGAGFGAGRVGHVAARRLSQAAGDRGASTVDCHHHGRWCLCSSSRQPHWCRGA